MLEMRYDLARYRYASKSGAMNDLPNSITEYRASALEKQREADILRLLPRNRSNVLEIGTRDGHYTRLLAEIFESVTALDLLKPSLDIPRVTPVRGDVTRLDFPDNSFDSVLCTEVLEHVPDLDRAARELSRVCRHELIIGVPFRQDLRAGRLLCQVCGKTNAPYGHLHSFDTNSLLRLFHSFDPSIISFVGDGHVRTNPLSVWLMNIASHPWGSYEQEEHCSHCDSVMLPKSTYTFTERACARLAIRLDRTQQLLSTPILAVKRSLSMPVGSWIHILFRKRLSSRI